MSPDAELPSLASLDKLVAEAAKVGRTSRTKLAHVEEALTAALQDGPRPAESVMQAVMRETHAGERTVRDAKARLNIVSERQGEGWVWRLPADGEAPETVH